MSVTLSRPVVERIAVRLFERLQMLAAGASDFVKVREVIRPTRIEDFTPKHMQVVLKQADVEDVPELSFPGNPPVKAKRQRFDVHCHLLPSEKDPTPIDEYATTLEAEVSKAITAGDADYWHTFGGLAVDAQIGPREPIAADGGVDGFTLPVFVVYRTPEQDPYTAR